LERENLTLYLGRPNWVYNKKITITYWSGETKEIWGGWGISHRPGGNPMKRTITFDRNGRDVVSDV